MLKTSKPEFVVVGGQSNVWEVGIVRARRGACPDVVAGAPVLDAGGGELENVLSILRSWWQKASPDQARLRGWKRHS